MQTHKTTCDTFQPTATSSDQKHMSNPHAPWDPFLQIRRELDCPARSQRLRWRVPSEGNQVALPTHPPPWFLNVELRWLRTPQGFTIVWCYTFMHLESHDIQDVTQQVVWVEIQCFENKINTGLMKSIKLHCQCRFKYMTPTLHVELSQMNHVISQSITAWRR